MKKLVLFLLIVLVFPIGVSAQEKEAPDYLKGAVPEVNGKVVFSKTFEVPYLTTNQLYDTMYAWAEERMANHTDSLVYSNPKDGLIVLRGIDTLVFSKKAYFTDESSISYIISILCVENSVEVTMEDLYYKYVVSYMNKPETYYAEELITDKAALKSNNKKLKKKEGKFRRHTVNYVQALYESVDKLYTTSVRVAAEVVNNPLQEEYVYLDVLPEPLIAAISESKVMVFVDEDEKEKAPVSWSGIKNSADKKIVTFSFDTSACPAKDAYKLAFFQKDGKSDDSPWLLINCVTKVNIDKENKTEVSAEISGVWMKR